MKPLASLRILGGACTVQVRINFTTDDLKIIRAIESMMADGYTKPAAVKELIRAGLAAKNEPINLTVNVNGADLPKNDTGFAYAETETRPIDDDQAMKDALAGWQ